MELANEIINSSTFSGFNAACGNIYEPLAKVTSSWSYGQPYTWYSTTYPNKTEQAFQVIRALMRAKIVKIQTLDKFFALMDEVIKVL